MRINKKIANTAKSAVKRIRIQTWMALGVIIILIPIIAIYLYSATGAEAEWYDDSFAYRQRWDFNHNAALTDRRVTYTINTQPLTTDKLQADCDDIRFTDNHGLLLKHQLTSSCDLVSTTFDVIIPTVINGDNYGYIYYGNPTATSVSQDVSSYTSLSPNGGAPTFSNEQEAPSPIAFWKFDEGLDNSCSGGSNDVCDNGSGRNDGAFGASTAAPTWQAENLCKSGRCLSFDGSNDTVTVSNTVAGIQSVSFWVKIFSNSSTEQILDLNGTDYITSVSGVLTVNNFGTDTIYVDAISGATTLTLNEWHHVEVTTTTAFSGSAIKFGQINTDYGNIYLDEVKLYSYARTDAQVKTDFARGAARGSSATLGAGDSALNNGLVGYWKLDEASGDALDSSGNNTTLTNRNTTPFNSAKYANGADLTPGSSQYFDAADNSVLSLTTSLTLSAWIKTDTIASGTYDVIGKFDGSNESYLLAIVGDASNAEVRMYVDSASIYGTTNTANLAIDTYYQIAGVYNSDSQTISLYVNGNLQASTTTGSVPSSIVDDTGKISLGAEDPTGGATNFFDGHIDDAKIYNRALNSSELTTLVNSGPPIKGYWKMDEGTGTSTTADSSGNSYVGSLNGTMTESDWVSGKYRYALDFDGSDDRVSVSNSGDFSTNAFTIAAWIYLKTDTENNIYIVDNRSADNTGWRIDIGAAGSNELQCSYDNVDSAGTASIAVNTWYHVACVSDGSTVRGYINGEDQGGAASVTAEGNIGSSTSMDIGSTSYTAYTFFFPGIIDDVRFYNYARTPAQLAIDMQGLLSSSSSPIRSQVSNWKFDTMAGQVVYDDQSNVNLQLGLTSSAEASDPTWTSPSNCKIGSCLDFDGSADGVVEPGTSSTLLDIYGDLSIGLWIKADTIQDAEQLMYLGDNDNATEARNEAYWLRWDTTSGNDLEYGHEHGLTTDPPTTESHIFDTNLSTSTWYRIVLTRDTSTNIVNIYINGKYIDTWTYTTDPNTGVSTPSGSLSMSIGASYSGSAFSAFFDGIIDEVTVYSAPLNSNQVLMDLNANSAVNFGVGQIEDSQLSGGAGNSPVLTWKLDENTGTVAHDTSATTNPNPGTLLNTPQWVPGKVGTGLAFSTSTADNDQVCLDTNGDTTCDDDADLDFAAGGSFTLETWFKHNTASSIEYIISKYAAAGYKLLMQADGDITCGLDYDATWTPTESVTSTAATYDDNNWHHAVCVKNANTSLTLYIDGISVGTPATSLTNSTLENTDPLYYGIDADGTTGDYIGQLDKLVIYNYARSQTQVSYDFNRGRPVAWYKFDECQGTTIYNTGFGGSLNGTWSGTGSGNTETGTCDSGTNTEAWNNGSSGKRNASLDFDDLDDIVSVTDTAGSPIDLTGGLSISAWVKTSANEADNVIVSKGTSYELGIDGSANVYWDGVSTQVDDGAGKATSGTWHNVVVTNDDTTVTYYVDGLTTGTDSAGIDVNNDTNLIIGGDGVNFFDGLIDDVRIYNYVLSATQVKKLLIEDAGARFGPSEGSPQ